MTRRAFVRLVTVVCAIGLGLVGLSGVAAAVVSPPAVTGVTPSTGTSLGGTPVTISGNGFTGATAVSFGAHPAANFFVESDSSMFAMSPAGTGTVDVTVTTAQGTSATGVSDQFTYHAPTAPVVTQLMPSSGSEVGGTSVIVSGNGFKGAMGVSFGGTPATNFSVESDVLLFATAPAGNGTVDVTVTTLQGTSATSASDQFTYRPPTAPTISYVSPDSGPTTGGTIVVLNGSDFTGTTSVMFGPNAATQFFVQSDQTITAKAPAGTGIVDVTATNTHGTSATGPTDQFTYRAPTKPSVTFVSPSSGSIAGGTSVSINGSDFTGVTAVMFGTHAATNVQLLGDNALMATSPAGTGTVDVTVTTAIGTSTANPSDQFTYSANAQPPTVTNVNPNSGPAGTTVTITGTHFTGANLVGFGQHPVTGFTVVDDSHISVTAPAGSGTVDVQVNTPNGLSPTSANDQFTYTSGGDTTPPVVQVTFAPGSTGWFTKNPAVGSIAADDATTGGSAVTGFSCPGATISAFSTTSATAASATVTVSGNGIHTLTCTASDGSGNTGAAAGSTNRPIVKIDTVPPNVTVIAPPAVTFAKPTLVRWGGTDSTSGIAGFDVQRADAPWNASFSAWANWKLATTATSATYPPTPGHTDCFRARAHDHAGLTSAWTTIGCTATPEPATFMLYSNGWLLSKSTHFYAGMAERTAVNGARASHSSIHAKHFSIIATECPTCGTVQVRWNNVVVANLNLHATTTKYEQILSLKAFTKDSIGTLTITDTSPNGKPDIIEGIDISQA